MLTLVLGGPGFVLRRMGVSHAAELDTVRGQLAAERDKDKRDGLVAEQERLQTRSSYELTFGTTAISGGATALLMAILLLRGVRLRQAGAALIIPLVTFCICAISKYDLPVAWLVPATVALALGAAWFALAPDTRSDREAEAFRRFPMRRTLAIAEDIKSEGHPYRGGDNSDDEPRAKAYRELFLKTEKDAAPKLLRKVELLSPEFATILPQIGEGRPVAFHQLRSGLAYVAFVESDAYNLSDYTAVLMRLEEPAPSFVVRPFSNDDGKGPPAASLKFRDDPEFTERYLVELGPKADPKHVRGFLADDIRGELADRGTSAWLYVSGSLMALVRFGPIEAAKTDDLVDLADFLFEVYGADGGPSLLEPDGIVGAGAPKKKKKKKAAPAEAASAT